jgi:hypothetical protein
MAAGKLPLNKDTKKAANVAGGFLFYILLGT